MFGYIMINTDEAMKSISNVEKNVEETGEKIEKFGKGLTKSDSSYSSHRWSCNQNRNGL